MIRVLNLVFIKIQDPIPCAAMLHRGRGREIVRIKLVMAWLGRKFRGLTNETLAKELQQEPAVLSRGLGKLASKLELRGVVETRCDKLRKGRGPKRSLRLARLYLLFRYCMRVTAVSTAGASFRGCITRVGVKICR